MAALSQTPRNQKLADDIVIAGVVVYGQPRVRSAESKTTPVTSLRGFARVRSQVTVLLDPVEPSRKSLA